MRKLLFLFMPISIFFIAHSAYASKADCSSDAVHCSYVSGLPTVDGRYMKIKLDNGMTIVGCANNTVTNELEQDQAQYALGNHSDTYYICTDDTYTTCFQVGQPDQYNVSGTPGDYKAVPKYYDIDLSPFANNSGLAKCEINRRIYFH